METHTFRYTDLHEEHVKWMNEIIFLNDDLKILKNRLDEIASKYNSKEVLVEVEKYQNKFIRLKEVNDELMHELKQNENMLEKIIKEKKNHAYELRFNDHALLREKTNTNNKIFAQTKQEFNQFLSKYM